MATYHEWIAQKQVLQAQIEEARTTEGASAIGQICPLMDPHELSSEDIASRRRRGRPAGAAIPMEEKAPRGC